MYARRADKADLPEVLVFCRRFWESLSYSKAIPFDQPSALIKLQEIFDQRMLFVAEEDMDLVGMIGGVISPCFANATKLVGAELFFWVEPAHRKSGAGKLMLDAIEAQARRVGCAMWSMMAIEELGAERVGALYEREGYRWTERSYAKIL